MTKIKVLVIDDSAVIRQLLTSIIDAEADMEVVATASDPYVAREQIKKHNPDVLTLDVEMPRMDGITFLKNLMRLRPMPVIMISTLTHKGAEVTLEAMNCGAFDFVSKPKENLGKGLAAYKDVIVEKIRAASQSNLHALETQAVFQSAAAPEPGCAPENEKYQPKTDALIAIGASTGGTEAIRHILMRLPKNCAPVVISQHIPVTFSRSLAKRLDGLCAMRVCHLEQTEVLQPGYAYIAPGDSHLVVKKQRGNMVAQLQDGEKVNRHKPSVEVMFDSIAALNLKHAVAALLTGMGADGSEALLRMKNGGCHTIIQDEQSSVVWGMPGVAFNLNAHCEVLALDHIAAQLLQQTSRVPLGN